ncbi:basic amino acid ABC transporter substrate-binding protein [Halomarina halobia]|uniref:Basic amino acid ABC transporter substrate-binding protein n=1 Tax=Halomarina halobia TaxID=3033386 RepID=A0ABD6A958_9EURY|nr:basic amino acid ABC transporter substrate-binding protein [Halomarina sp. PSR21]
MSHGRSLGRRAYLKAVGAGSVVALAGCLTGGGNGGAGDGDGNGTGNETGNETGNQTGNGTGDVGGTIVPGTAPGFPPFEIKEGGELTGFDVELLEAVVAETSYELGEWKEFEFDSLIQALTSGNIDVIAAAMTITEEREQTISFTNSYYEADQSILVAKGGDFSPSSLDDLSGRPIGAQKGTTGEQVVQEELVDAGKLEPSNYKAYDNYVLAVTDLENGNVDAVVLDKPVAQTFQQERDVEIAFTYETGEAYGFGVRKDDNAVRQALNEGLQAVEENGTYEELRNKWFSEA